MNWQRGAIVCLMWFAVAVDAYADGPPAEAPKPATKSVSALEVISGWIADLSRLLRETPKEAVKSVGVVLDRNAVENHRVTFPVNGVQFSFEPLNDAAINIPLNNATINFIELEAARLNGKSIEVGPILIDELDIR